MSKFLFSVLALFMMMQMHSQQKTISGIVSDSTGPLPGVNVIIKGTTTGTETDFDGAYSIKTNLGDVLQFSFIGMVTVEKIVGVINVMDIKMEPDDNSLEEVIVSCIAIKKQRKSLAYSPQIISGQAAGLQINNSRKVKRKSNSKPLISEAKSVTSNNTITLRGNRSVSAKNEALIVIDGILQADNSYFDKINPDNIKSLEVSS